MKKFGKFLKWVFAFIISIILFIALTVLSVMNSTEGLISKDTIQDVIMELDFNEFLNNEIGDKIYEVLDEAGVPKEYVTDMLNQEEVKEYTAIYLSEVVDYALNPKEIPELNAEEIAEVLKTSFDQVVNEVNNIDSIDRVDPEYIESIQNQITVERQEKIKEKIDEYTPKIVEAVPKVEEFVSDNIEENETVTEGKRKIQELQVAIEKIEQIYSYKIWVSVVVLICIGLLILLKYKKCHFIKWIFFPFVFTGLGLLCITGYLPELAKQVVQKIDYLSYQGIEPIIRVIINNFNETSYLCLAIAGILLFIQVGVLIYLRMNKKQN